MGHWDRKLAKNLGCAGGLIGLAVASGPAAPFVLGIGGALLVRRAAKDAVKGRLLDEMESSGVPTELRARCRGKLQSGDYSRVRATATHTARHPLLGVEGRASITVIERR